MCDLLYIFRKTYPLAPLVTIILSRLEITMPMIVNLDGIRATRKVPLKHLVLEAICKTLKCQPGDILEYCEETEETEET